VIYSEGKRHLAYLDAQSGQLFLYSFEGRSQDQLHNRGRTGTQRFSSAAEAKAHLRAIATALGVPASATLANFVWKTDGQVRDQNTAGEVGAVFKDATGKVVAALHCDPQDGALVEFSRTRP
jgi:hypothetical protein